VVASVSGGRANHTLMRTTDAFQTVSPGGDYSAVALPRWHNGVLYWLVEGGMIASRNRGETWERVTSEIRDGQCGPVFGTSPRHMFVVVPRGVRESTDGGTRWSPVVPLPPRMGKVTRGWVEYDPCNDVLYLMQMASELCRLERAR
jgi:hypothetical protein